MRIVKLFLICAIFLFLLMTLLSAMIPTHLLMSRAIDIHASRESVFNQINDLKEWENWNVFISNVDLTNKSITRPSNGMGAAIRSDKLQITISRSSVDSIITTWKQSQAKTFNFGFQLLELSPGTITVHSYLEFHFRWYPWEKLSSLLYEKQFGPAMEESLSKLKEFVERRGPG